MAMMRPGVKHDSYLALARTLGLLGGRDWHLAIIGDGPLRSEVEAAFAGHPAERVRWLGALPHEAVMAELGRHDVLVWPGLGEAYGLVYLEAQALELPVIAYASGGVPATVKDGETALLAPEGDEPALAAALSRLIDDPALRRSMGEAAAAFMAGERSAPAAGQRLADALALAFETMAARR